MRLAVCTLSAILLSGCSWLGGGLGGHSGQNNAYNASGRYASAQGAQARGKQYRGPQAGPCQIFVPTQPIPHGCDPASVTLAAPGAQYGGQHAGGFPQTPQFGNTAITGGYGSHAADAHNQSAHYQPKKRLRKPKWRGSLSLGGEKSNGGDYLNYDDAGLGRSQLIPTTIQRQDGSARNLNTFRFGGFNPSLNYNPFDFREDFTEGSPPSGTITDTRYFADVENVDMPNISFDDVHSTPVTISGGVEYIASPRTTLFANAGYSYAEGEDDSGITIDGRLLREVRTRTFTESMVSPGTFIQQSDDTNTSFIPNVDIAHFNFSFSDLERINLEAGARHYFNPIFKNQTQTSITPFIGAAAGASHYNAQSFTISQEQLFYERAFESDLETLEFYEPPSLTQVVDVYDSQWVPQGSLTAGVEWQMTPKTALAFETGLRIEGARDYSNGTKGDTNVAIPFTIRGSYNF